MGNSILREAFSAKFLKILTCVFGVADGFRGWLGGEGWGVKGGKGLGVDQSGWVGGCVLVTVCGS